MPARQQGSSVFGGQVSTGRGTLNPNRRDDLGMNQPPMHQRCFFGRDRLYPETQVPFFRRNDLTGIGR